jgi:hypothetical protein
VQDKENKKLVHEIKKKKTKNKLVQDKEEKKELWEREEESWGGDDCCNVEMLAMVTKICVC